METKFDSKNKKIGKNGGPVSEHAARAIFRATKKGIALDPALNQTMRSVLGIDFSNVKMHLGDDVDQIALALGAKAFTVGSDIFIHQDAYAPASKVGRELIAHELVHVVQQSTGRVKGGERGYAVGPTADVFEQEADEVARGVIGHEDNRRKTYIRPLSRGTASFLNSARMKRRYTKFPSHVIQRTAAGFATQSKTGPIDIIQMIDDMPHGFTCHMAAMYWIFRDAGDTADVANERLKAILAATCEGCVHGHHVHLSLKHEWYSNNMCGGAVAIADRASMSTDVQVGDVLLVGDTHAPAHSMVVVGKRERPRKRRYIRGFNNKGTLDTGQKDRYDNNDRDIDKDKFWHEQTAGVTVTTRFGLSYSAGGPLHRIPYATYLESANAVRVRCNEVGGVWTYVAPPL
jgi:hypothetical protein